MQRRFGGTAFSQVGQPTRLKDSGQGWNKSVLAGLGISVNPNRDVVPNDGYQVRNSDQGWNKSVLAGLGILAGLDANAKPNRNVVPKNSGQGWNKSVLMALFGAQNPMAVMGGTTTPPAVSVARNPGQIQMNPMAAMAGGNQNVPYMMELLRRMGHFGR